LNLVLIVGFHDAFDLSHKSLDIFITNRTRSVNCNTNISLCAGLHAGHNCIHVPATTIRTEPAVVVFDCALDLLLQQFTPVDHRLGQVFDQTLDTCRQVSAASGLCGLQQCFANFIFDSIAFFLAQSRTTFAATVNLIAVLAVISLFAVQVLVQHLINQILNVDFICFFVKVIVYFFSAPAFVLGVVQARCNFISDALFNQITVNAKVSGAVKQFTIPFAVTAHVIVDIVQHFMPKQKLQLFGFEFVAKFGIVVKFTTVCGRSGQPTVCIDQL